ncbi:hypothetical protein MKW98_006456 [Papaver atlanticum]|uniref:Uncharacterized protein n=1 Tax=Papaver atlanticum TaxID=357466 RepID=A0AAD4SFZ4_9MAGN|nr:hypothetical protein MKW98_006456 [Papaver atlanticum]
MKLLNSRWYVWEGKNTSKVYHLQRFSPQARRSSECLSKILNRKNEGSNHAELFCVGGIGINLLEIDYSGPPRLVCHLDKYRSVVLVLGRTQIGATIPSLKKKAFEASTHISINILVVLQRMAF